MNRIHIPKRPVGKTAIEVTYSELNTYRDCPLKHQWRYQQGWHKPPQEGSALSRGTLWHEVMELHYEMIRRGATDVDRIRDYVLTKLLIDPDSGKQTEQQELVEWMYQGHLEAYGIDPEWEILQVEAAGRVALPGSRKYHLRFKTDLLVRERSNGLLWLVDHKTAGQFQSDDEIDIDDQFGLYTWAARRMGVPVHGFIRSQVRTRRNKGPMTLEQRLRRQRTYRTDIECDHIARDALAAAKAAHGASVPVYSSPDPRTCTWKCEFMQAHIMYRKGMDPQTTLADMGFEKSDRRHREYAPSDLLADLPDDMVNW